MDLHNEFSTAILLCNKFLRNLSEKETYQPDAEKLRDFAHLLEASYENARNKSHILYNDETEDSFWSTLQQQAGLYFTGTSIATHFIIEPMTLRLNKESKVIVLMCVRELVANILKHAQARSVYFMAYQHEHFVCFDVQDDGKGFPNEPGSFGLGISTIRNKIEELNGQFSVYTAAPSGSVVSIQLPAVSI